MPRVQYKQKFRSQWSQHPTLKDWISEDQNDSAKASCKYCKCSLAGKLSDLIAHAATGKHKAYSHVTSTNSRLPFQRLTTASQEKEATLALFVAAHCSIAPVDHLTASCTRIFEDSKDIRMHRTKCTQIIKNVLAPHFSQALVDDIGQSPFSILIDESTDISITKLLGLAINYFSCKENRIVSTYLSLTEIECGGAQAIFGAVKKVLNRLKLQKKNMVGIGTDNANVMVGCRNSVYTLLKAEIPNLLAMRCVCHSIQLAVSHACKVHLPTKLEFLVHETYNWFSNSPLRQMSYKKVYNAINDGEDPLKITRTYDTRWLSIEVAVCRIIDQWLELKTHFGIAAAVEKCHKAKLLFEMYKDETVLAFLYFLRPLLTEMQKLNKTFQSHECDPTKLLQGFNRAFAILKDKIISPDDDIDVIKTDFKPFIKRDCDLGYNFENIIKKLRLNGSIKDEEMEIRLKCTEFVVCLIDELRNRLPDNYQILQHVNFFSAENTLRVPKQNITPILEVFKVDACEIEKMCLQYNTVHLIPWVNVTNTTKLWGEIRSYTDAAGNPVFKELCSFVIKLLTLPWSNAEIERVFSQMNVVKTKLRNRMELPTLDSILCIRFGLKRLKKCCKDYIIPREVLFKIGTNCSYVENSVSYTNDVSLDQVLVQIEQ